MKLSLSIFLFVTCQCIALSQFDDLMNEIDVLSEGEQFELVYVKTGDWGTYEGGNMTFIQHTQDSITIELANQQNYLGAEEKKSSTSYLKLDLLSILMHNKQNYHKDPNNIVFNNRFNYTINKNGRQLSQSSLPMEPKDIVNMVSLDHQLKNIFLKEEKGLFGKSPIQIKN